MPVIEHPTEEVNPLTDPVVVLIRVDPVASVAPLGDDQATRQAALLSPKKLLVVYNGGVNMEYDPELGGLRMNASFRLAGRGRPSPPVAAAAIPIAPAPALADTGRAPVRTTPIFPWDDCYVYTLETISASVCRIHQDSSVGYEVDPEDVEAYDLAAIDDGIAFASVVYAFKSSSSAGSDYNLPIDKAADDASGSSKDTDVLDVLPHLIRPDNAKQMRLSAEMWLQASSDDELSTPREFDETVKQLKKIERECVNRIIASALSKGPETTAWLDGISSPNAEPGPSAEIESPYTGELDDLISPKDAIEHRQAQTIIGEDASQAEKSAEATAPPVFGPPAMHVIEDPVMTVECIELGDVVVVSLDPIASVAPLDDPEATAAASKIPRRKYLAIVSVYTDFDVRIPGYVTPLALKFYAVGRGLPEVAGASVPLAAGLAHPTSRAPVELALPAHFADCYVHTLQIFKARVQRIYTANPSGIRLSRSQLEALDRALSEDMNAQAKPYRQQSQMGEPIRIPLEDEDPDEPYEYDLESEFFVKDGVAPDGYRPQDYPTQPAAIARVNDEAAAPSPDTASSAPQPVASEQAPATQSNDLRAGNLAQHNAALAQVDEDPTANFPDMVISLDMWLDLGTAEDSEIGSPKELMEHIAQLIKIEYEWAFRKMRAILAAERDGTNNWLANVVPDGPVPGGDDVAAAAGDDIILPDEHRVGKGNNEDNLAFTAPSGHGTRTSSGRKSPTVKPRTLSSRAKAQMRSWFCMAPKTTF